MHSPGPTALRAPESSPSAPQLSVLVLTRNFPPLRGGMERLVQETVHGLLSACRVAVVGPAGCRSFLDARVTCLEAPLRPLSLALLSSLLAGMRLAVRVHPDLILCGSGLMAPFGWLIGRLFRIPVAVMVHGLDIVAPHPVYRRFFVPAIAASDRVIANSRHTAELALAAGVSADRLRILHPGVTPTAGADRDAVRAFRREHGLAGPVMLSVGRLTERKGLVEFVQQCLASLVARWPSLTLLVVGGEAGHALGKDHGPLLPRLRATADQAGVGSALKCLGDVSEATLDLAFAAADVLVFPVRQMPGDVEGFGMVALEAAAHGVPSVAFRVGGVPDAVAEGRSGRLVEPQDYAAFAAAVADILGGQCGGVTPESCRSFALTHTWADRHERLLLICAELVRR